MLYELHLSLPTDAFLTADMLLQALANSGATWEIVEPHENASFCLLCTASAHAWEIVQQDDLLTLSLPVNLTGLAARSAFDLLWQTTRCLQTLISAPLFDPQLGATVSPDSPFDTEKVLLSYAGVVRHQQSFEL